MLKCLGSCSESRASDAASSWFGILSVLCSGFKSLMENSMYEVFRQILRDQTNLGICGCAGESTSVVELRIWQDLGLHRILRMRIQGVY